VLEAASGPGRDRDIAVQSAQDLTVMVAAIPGATVVSAAGDCVATTPPDAAEEDPVISTLPKMRYNLSLGWT
jgi:hypothetical protein